ncbi:hypothetical protein KSP40_PGU001534 [Platanthera guangdongensis]|uniref:Uncharacterized protein n=1 Tax=Platanthera guangdongensis TaxID=2320717 RepID=A0ABR2MWK4_9ASPA
MLNSQSSTPNTQSSASNLQRSTSKLQRSTSSFRRQGSSGRIWNDPIPTIELKKDIASANNPAAIVFPEAIVFPKVVKNAALDHAEGSTSHHLGRASSPVGPPTTQPAPKTQRCSFSAIFRPCIRPPSCAIESQ